MFKKYGRYSQLHPNTNLRIIALNPFTYNALNTYIWDNNTDPQDDFAWLMSTLQFAEDHNENVIILGHIAPTIFDTERNWNILYNALIDRYTNIIKLQLFGHSHADNMQTIRAIKNKNEIVGVTFLIPQLGVLPSENPSFRVFDLDGKNYDLTDYHQYRLYLQEAKYMNAPYWRLAYKFTDLYNISDCSYRNIGAAIEKIKVSE
jgi:sphingomyelin phosphodiesterase